MYVVRLVGYSTYKLKMSSFKGQASCAEGASPRGKLTELTKKVNKAVSLQKLIKPSTG